MSHMGHTVPLCLRCGRANSLSDVGNDIKGPKTRVCLTSSNPKGYWPTLGTPLHYWYSAVRPGTKSRPVPPSVAWHGGDGTESAKQTKDEGRGKHGEMGTMRRWTRTNALFPAQREALCGADRELMCRSGTRAEEDTKGHRKVEPGIF